MSVVTGVLILGSCVSEDLDIGGGTIQAIDKWLADHGFGPVGGRDLANYAGGNKHPQTILYHAGYNAFLEDDFLAFLDGLDFDDDDGNVVVALQPETGKTRLWRPGVGILD